METDRQQTKKFNEWRKRTAKGMPLLAERLFALRNRGYLGCGSHWSLEKSLGVCIVHLNNYDEGYRDMGLQISVEVVVEHLYKEVSKIEKSLN